MDDSSLIAVARRMLDAGPADYHQAASTELLRLIPGDDAIWMRADFTVASFSVWRASAQAYDHSLDSIAPMLYDHPGIQSYLRNPSDLAPRKISDLPAPRREVELAALRISQQYLGREQLSLVLSATPPVGGHGWVVTRDSGAFGKRELDAASLVYPPLLVFDHFHVPKDVRVERDERWAELTSRERQVVDLLTTGLTARAIARLLGISSRTVDKHLENSYRKLGQHDRLAVAVELTATGAIPQTSLPNICELPHARGPARAHACNPRQSTA